MGTNGKLQQASMDFAINLIQFYERVECKAFLKNQLARSGTSIGANIHESTYAESPEDFIHKLGIALKECNETEYWLNLVAEICPDLKDDVLQLKQNAGSIRRMLISSIVKVKQRLGIIN